MTIYIIAYFKAQYDGDALALVEPLKLIIAV